jgi:hypothetical protein
MPAHQSSRYFSKATDIRASIIFHALQPKEIRLILKVHLAERTSPKKQVEESCLLQV